MSVLSAEKREVFRRKLAGARKDGKLPAVMYGPKEETSSIFVNAREFTKVLKEAGETTVISLKLPEGAKDVLIHSIDLDPVKDVPVHVDFYAIDKTKKITVSVPLEFVGVSNAVKSLGGTLVKVLHEIEVEALPNEIPHEIEINIELLSDLDSKITIADIKLPEGVSPTHGKEETIANITVAKEEEEEGVAAPDLSEIEVEKKGKKEDEEAEEKEGEKPAE